MKIIKKLNIKKIFRSLKSGVLSTNIFFILFAAFFSSLALAAALTITHVDNRIPAGATGCFSSKLEQILNTTSVQTYATELKHDRTEDIRDVLWSDDGTMVFTINDNMNRTKNGYMGDLDLSMNKVRDPFELKTVKTTLGIHTCDDIDGFDVDHPDFLAQGMSADTTEYVSIHAALNGTIFFILSETGELHKYNLSKSFDFRTATYENEFALNSEINSFSFSKDGTRLFALNAEHNTMELTTFSLSSPFNTSITPTQIHIVDLSTIGIDLVDGENSSATDVEFNDDGSEMFISVFNQEGDVLERIHQFSLGKNYDVSTASHIGSVATPFVGRENNNGWMGGFTFSSDGMKLFTSQRFTGPAVDQIFQYNLQCPYGIAKCSSDTSSSIEAQFELAKQNISLNVNTIFKRFEWIKRNRDDENLSAHNFKINYEDPLLKTLANKFEPSVRNNVASFISKHKTENKKSKWSSWSLADISLSIFEIDGSVKAKDLNTRGLTLGTDRKFGDNKFFGLALRYGDSSSDIKFSKQDVTMESLTLNLYGILPSKDNQYINAVVGLSHLWYDHRYMGNLSGERKGKQAFATINYRTKEKYGILNVTPTGKLTYGVTRLSEFTDFLAKASGLPARDVIYKEDTFTSGELAAGFLFETDIIETDQGTVQPMGGIEILYDLTSDVDYKYVYQGGTHVNKETIHSPFSRQNLKTSIGFEAIHLNGFTVSTEYQRIIRLNDTSEAPGFSTDTFIIKFSRSKEEDDQFALNYDPINAHQTNLSYSKNIHGLDFKINSNQSLENSSEYFTNLEVSGKF